MTSLGFGVAPSAPRAEDVFVGREEVLALLAASPADRTMIDLQGATGSGKTKLLGKALERLGAERPLALAVEVYESDRPEGDAAREAPSEVRQAYRRFRQVLGSLADDILRIEQRAGRARSELPVGAAKDALRVATREAQDAARELAPDALDRWIRESQDQLAQSFAMSFEQVLEDRSAVLVIDNFEHVRERSLGDWLLDVGRRLPRTLLIVSRTPSADDLLGRTADGPVELALEPLAREEVALYLRTCLPGIEVGDRLVDGVHSHTEGVPRSVWSATVRISREGPDPFLADVARPARVASAGPTGPEPDDMEDARSCVDGTPCEPVVRACCVLRSFDAAFLEAMLERPEGDGARLIEEMARQQLLSPPVGHGAPEGTVQLKRFIRRAYDATLRQADDDAWRRANRRAAAHVQSLVADYEGAPAESFVAWSLYDRPDWQFLAREWLYYEARGAGTDAERRESRVRFLRYFLDAFFWWGCYIDFPFISELLDDWETTQGDPELATCLRDFVAAYPTGYAKDPDPTRWAAARRALQDASRLCGLPADHARLAPEQRHVGALIRILLAHAWRYRATDDPAATRSRARELYDAALELLASGPDEDWAVAWTRFERTELAAEGGAAGVREEWGATAALAAELGDDELVANLHRLAADVRWAESPLDALRAHGRAILRAYLFLGRAEAGGSARPPDAYTRAFYAEQIERASGRARAHADAGGDPAQAAAALLTGFPETSAGASPPGLFPRPPSDAELGEKASPFMSEWSDLEWALDESTTEPEESAW